jgi:hypothetical protein
VIQKGDLVRLRSQPWIKQPNERRYGLICDTIGELVTVLWPGGTITIRHMSAFEVVSGA